MATSLDSVVGPETSLLFYCARTQVTSDVAATIRSLVANPLEWVRVLDDAARHSITPLLECNFVAFAPDVIPPTQLTKLKSIVQANAARSLLLAAELLKLDESFRAQGVLPIPYKGPVLAAQAYGNVALRQFDDLDIILLQRHLPAAHEVLVSLGYQPRFPAQLVTANSAATIPGEYKYYDPSREIIVELHTEFTLRHFPQIPNLEELSQRLVSVTLVGGQIRTFAPEDVLPILCVHGAKDFWDRLSWVVDVSELIHSYPNLDWDRVFRLAESLRAQRMLHVGLSLASSLLDAPLPPGIASRIENDTMAVALAEDIQRRLVTRDDSLLDSAVARFAYRRRMVAGAVAGWSYALRLAFASTAEEWQSAAPPNGLGPISAGFRPVRFLLKYRGSRRSPRA